MAKYEFEMKEPIEHCWDCPMYCYSEFNYDCEGYPNDTEFYCKLNKDITSGILSTGSLMDDDEWADLPNKEQCPLKRLA